MFGVKIETMTPPSHQYNVMTPVRQNKQLAQINLFSPSPSIKPSPAAIAAQRGHVKFSLNEHLKSLSEDRKPANFTLLQTSKYKVQFTYNLSDENQVWQVQNQKFRSLTNQMLSNLNVNVSGVKMEDGDEYESGKFELADFERPHQTEVYIAGIVSAPEVLQNSLENRKFDRKLDPSSVFLESEYGELIQLNLDLLESFSIFPGQFVIAKGTNPHGRIFHVSSLITGALPPKFVDNREAQQSFDDCVIFIANAPFSAASELDYDPLDTFLTEVSKYQPDFVVLTGPFLDSDHKVISSGSCKFGFEHYFQHLMEHIASKIPSSVQVVVVPSVRDINHDFTFPQRSFRYPKTLQNFHFVSNPSTVRIEPIGFEISVTSTDTLMDLSRSEFSRNSSGQLCDRISELMIHLLQQQNLYPIFPPPQISEINLDDPENYLHISSIPDLLILPSSLTSFAKIPQGIDCIGVNPGSVAKGDSFGSYARAIISAGQGSFSHRTRVDIVRL
jgi:hypothetical protein